jgi:hypothetical protein
MNGATFRVSEQLMPHILLLPEGTRVLDIILDMTRGQRDFVVVVEHPDLPEVEGGMPWPEAMPTYKRTAKHDHVKFIGWGLEGKQ